MKQHFPALDGLRGVAALSVFVFHALDPFGLSSLTPHAQLGVDFFFLLSGFVLAHAYEAKLKAGLSFGAFAVIRLIRLYPLVLLGLSFGLLVFLAKLQLDDGASVGLKALIAVVCGLTFLPTPFDIAPGWLSVAPLNPPSWSLIFEFWANLAYAGLARRLKTRVLLLVVALSGLLLLYQAQRLGFVNGGDRWAWIAYGPGRVTFSFFCGVLLYRLRPSALGRHSDLSPLLLALLAAVLLTPAIAAELWLYEGVAVIAIFPLIIWLAALDEPGPRVAKFYLFAGRLSYPLYILHYPFVRIFNNVAKALGPEGPMLWTVLAAELATVVLVAYGAMKLFDEPLRRRLTQVWRGAGAPRQPAKPVVRY